MHKSTFLRYLCLPLLLLLLLVSTYTVMPAHSAYFPITASSTATATPSTTPFIPTSSLTPSSTPSPLPTSSPEALPIPSPSPTSSPTPTLTIPITSLSPSPTLTIPTTSPSPSPIIFATPIIGAFHQHQRQAPASANLLVSGSVGSATSPSSITLDGNNHTVTYQVPASVTTIIGSAAQWTLSITSTQFSTGGAHPTTLSTTASTITSTPALSCLAVIGSCITPTNTISYPLTVPAASTAPAAVNYYSGSAPSGVVLTFTITPTINVYLPASTPPGTYSSTVTVVLSSGP